MGIRIGNIEISGLTALAPLAGVTDRTFRVLCREQGASLVVTEMVSARGLVEGGERTSRFLDFEADEFPISVQIFGSEPDMMAEGAKILAERNPDIIDINCGCPVKKIVNRNAGAALLNDPVKLGKIVSAMSKAVEIPITLKIRSGWNDSNRAVEVAQIAESSGASAISVHGRTRKAAFSGNADWNIICEVKQAVSIPVIGNGDVRGPEVAKEIIARTGCDMVMIGRWAIGNPWIFRRIESYLSLGRIQPEPTFRDRIEMAVRHLRLSVQKKGFYTGVREVRRHISAYVKGIPGSEMFRQKLMTQEDPDGVEEVLKIILDQKDKNY